MENPVKAIGPKKTYKRSAAFSKQLNTMRWDCFKVGLILCGYKRRGDYLIAPIAYECVGKRDMRKGCLQVLLLELCFELTVEKSADGIISGSASILKGCYVTGEPVAVDITKSLSVTTGVTVSGENVWEREDSLSPMQFRVKESSYFLRNANGVRIFAGEK